MRAAIMRTNDSTEIEVVDGVGLMPVVDRHVRVRIRATGVCHSDLHALDGEMLTMVPAVLGHEGAGEVVEVGQGVTSVAVGDHVVIAWAPPCGACTTCVSHGAPHLCAEVQMPMAMARNFTLPDGDTAFGYSGAGTFAEELICPEQACIRIADDVPFDVASLIGCGVTTGVGAVWNAAGVEPGTTCVVIGVGGVGMSVLQACRIAGAAQIIAVDVNAGKLELARTFGATHAVPPEEMPRLVRKLTGRAGADYAFEAVGRPETARAAYDATRRGGTTVIVGMGSADRIFELNMFELFYGDKTLRGSYYGSGDIRRTFDRIIALWRSGQLNLEGMISQRIGLAELPDAFASMRTGEPIRILVEP